MCDSELPTIEVVGVSKMYKVFPSRMANFVDAIGLARWTRLGRNRHREFWALRDVNLTVQRGERIGIIGCNGAGKSTLLKLITGNIPPTEGTVTVRGEVHALMQTGAGFHPEFTGRENIVASLVQQGMSRREIDAAIDEIVEFTELEEFLDNPFKTYSAGMQARLTFATATTIHPEVLIIDEILGAGDGYFIAKSTERITRLVQEYGATVLLVSHSLATITRFCQRAFWIDRGKVRESGPALEVVKSYEQFLRLRTERRLRAKNEARRSRLDGGAEAALTYRSHVVISVAPLAAAGSETVDVCRIALQEGPDEYESVDVGDAQDADPTRQAAIVTPDGHGWSPPKRDQQAVFRSIPRGTVGQAIFYLYSFVERVDYVAHVTLRASPGPVRIQATSDGVEVGSFEIDATREWNTVSIDLQVPRQEAAEPTAEPKTQAAPASDHATVRRWPGEGSISIQSVELVDDSGSARAVFRAGQPMSLWMTVRGERAGDYPIVPTAAIYRLDGVPVTRHRGSVTNHSLARGETRRFCLDFGPLNLGDGNYVVSVGVFREFDAAHIDDAAAYEIIDRSYEFEVDGNSPNMDAVFQHPGKWSAVDDRSVQSCEQRRTDTSR